MRRGQQGRDSPRLKRWEEGVARGRVACGERLLAGVSQTRRGCEWGRSLASGVYEATSQRLRGTTTVLGGISADVACGRGRRASLSYAGSYVSRAVAEVSQAVRRLREATAEHATPRRRSAHDSAAARGPSDAPQTTRHSAPDETREISWLTLHVADVARCTLARCSNGVSPRGSFKIHLSFIDCMSTCTCESCVSVCVSHVTCVTVQSTYRLLINSYV